MQIIIQLRKDLAELTGQEERFLTVTDPQDVEIEVSYFVNVYNWYPALKEAAIEVNALNDAFGSGNPIF